METVNLCELENIDGFFSGILYINNKDQRYVLEFGYDIEYKNLKLMNCTNSFYNAEGTVYTFEDLEKIRVDYLWLIIEEIKAYLW